MTYLIINADDFGLTPGVNRSILELHREGALSSATLMATADQFQTAASCARNCTRLGVGCHIVLVDGKPALPYSNIPGLALASGHFRPSLGPFIGDLVRGRIPESEIEAEATAQIRRLQNSGIHVTHLDTHKHTHMFLRVLRPLLRAAQTCGVRAVRNPFEPEWAVNAAPHAAWVRRQQIRLMRARRSVFFRTIEHAGLTTTDGAIGILATGSLDSGTLHRLLSVAPSGTWELVCHPGYIDPAPDRVRTRLRESRALEHEALL
ncbi:MAG: ChbG/HpnK family deacetylase, partial [Silvibacterium sp.]|nr:ChbG/HpnK family deacetylase [Silvibacterium sp.]